MELAEIMQEEGFLPARCGVLLTESVNAIIHDMRKAEVDVANLALADLGMFANPVNNMKLVTIHHAKGREFSAVALIGLHDGIIPFHNKHVLLTADAEAEARRVLYVAVTRAKRALMFFTSRGEWRPQCRFIAPLGLPGASPLSLPRGE